MGIDTDPQRFQSLTQAVRDHSVERCLPYPGMADIPEGYSRFAEQDARARDFSWQDVCPAYALALLTYGGYRLPEDEESLETLWDELGGESVKLWPEVSQTLLRGWRWLAEHRSEAMHG